MLHIEVDKRLVKSWKPQLGTYKINTKLIDGINICEYNDNKSSMNKLCEGYIDINNISKIRLFLYSPTNRIESNEYFLDYVLPNEKFEDSWTMLIYDESFKYEVFDNVFKYHTMDKRVGSLMGINKSILLHGDPGVGKTTFCKALCQKLSIRIQKPIILREISCNKIISRFYGESIKNLHKVIETAMSDTIFVFDEADSLLLARDRIMRANEPNDSLRIVNSLLQLIDRGDHTFIFISNYKDELESAILDRCDLIIEMKSLGIEKTYKLIKNTLEKLMELDYIQFHQFLELSDEQSIVDDEGSSDLLYISKKIFTQSPRRIKKMIFESTTGEKEMVQTILKKIINKL